MKKKIFLLIALSQVLMNCIYAQNSIWKFGNNGGLQFNSNGTTSPHSGSSYAGSNAATGITDADGNLIFYTDGKNLWEGSNNIVSTSLPGSLLSTQAPIIVPAPGKCYTYLVFTTGAVLDNTHYQNPSIFISVVTVNETAPPYTIASITSSSLNISGFDEKIALIKDNSSNGFWLAIHKFKDPYGDIYPNGKLFFIYHITSTIMASSNTASELTFALSNSGQMTTGVLDHAGGVNGANAMGQMKFNKQGTKLALVISEMRQIEMYNFDKVTGMLTFLKHFTAPATTLSDKSSNLYGLEFSPDGNLLYISESYHSSSGVQKRLFQVNYNLFTPSFAILAQTNSIAANENTYNGLQLGTNDKIYVSGPREGNSALSIIDYPNIAGSGASFYSNAVSISGTNRVGLPSCATAYVTPKLTVSPSSISLCSPQNTILTAKGGDAYYWDPTGETTQSIAVNPATTTTYTAYTALSTGCQTFKTVTINIGVIATPVITSTSYLSCPEIPTATMSLTNGTTYYNGATFQWQKGNCYSFSDIPSATGYSHSITQGYGKYRVKVGCNGNFGYSNDIPLYYLSSCSLPPPNCNGGGGCQGCREDDGVSGYETNKDVVNLYPNPTNGVFFLAYTSVEEVEAVVSIMNLLGKEVYKENHIFNKGENKLQIDLGNHPKGVHYVKVASEKKQLGFKISYQ